MAIIPENGMPEMPLSAARGGRWKPVTRPVSWAASVAASIQGRGIAVRMLVGDEIEPGMLCFDLKTGD
jgi:hypothetical protein